MARGGKMSKTVSAMASTFNHVGLHPVSKPSTNNLLSTNPYSLLGEQALESSTSLSPSDNTDDRSETLELVEPAINDDSETTHTSHRPAVENKDKVEAVWTLVAGTKRQNTGDNVTNHLPVNVRDLDTWRSGNIGPSTAGYQLPRGNAPHKSRMFPGGSKFPNLSGPRTLGGVLLENIKPGTVMWRYDNRLCSDPNIEANDSGLFYGPSGEKWHRKGRYWVVVYRCRDHVMELPIYTFKDAGLANKPEKLKDTYSSVRAPNVSDFVNQNPDQMVIEIAYALNEDENFRSTMVVHCNEIFSHTSDVLEARVVGQLTGQSRDELMRRARSFIGTWTND